MHLRIAAVFLGVVLWGAGCVGFEEDVGRGGDALRAVPCGDNLCRVDEVCCNASCGICAPIENASCTQQYCGPPVPQLEPCGDVYCVPGTFCCNASCNLCLPPDMACTKQACESPLP